VDRKNQVKYLPCKAEDVGALKMTFGELQPNAVAPFFINKHDVFEAIAQRDPTPQSADIASVEAFGMTK
jgi:hypothetical protein